MVELGGQARSEGLEALVRWLALPYAGREPVFAGADGLGTIDGQPMPGAVELRDLYREVVGPGDPPRGDVEWRRCPSCSMWQVVPTEEPLGDLIGRLRVVDTEGAEA